MRYKLYLLYTITMLSDWYICCILLGFRNRLRLVDNGTLLATIRSSVYRTWKTIQRRDHCHHTVHPIEPFLTELDCANVFIQLECHPACNVIGMSRCCSSDRSWLTDANLRSISSLQLLSTSVFKNGGYRMLYNWHSPKFYEYWPSWSRKFGCFLQIFPLLTVPLVGIIQSYLYLTDGPLDLFEVSFKNYFSDH